MINRLKDDFKQSLRDKNTIRKNMVQMIRSNIQLYALDKKVTEDKLTEEEIISVISREVKQQNDSLEAFKLGNREDLVKETEKRLEILMEYMPKQLAIEEIEGIVKETLEELGLETVDNKQRGKLMGALMPKVKGKADGKIVNQIVAKYIVK